MQLQQALRLDPFQRPVVAFVGGGGKSTAMFRLARELAETGRRVVVTTTTRIFVAQIRHSPASLTVDDLDRLSAHLDCHRQALVLRGTDGSGKALGVEPDVITGLAARADVDAILVEADGSRMKPFKAPAEHEPVVPPETTHFVPVVGADVLGRPLDDDNVHRAERVAALVQAPLGQRITPEMVAAVLSHPLGGLKGRPAEARVVPLVNKADHYPTQAEAIARALLQARGVTEVIVGAVSDMLRGVTVWGRTAGVILAAGEATRYRETKQLLPWRGQPMVAHVARVALDAGLEPVMVVVGNEAEAVAAAVDHLPVLVVSNPAYADGQSTSVRAALSALSEQEASPSSALFLLADQPLVTAEMITKLRDAHRRTLAPIVAPHFQGRRGNPVLFDCTLWDELMAVGGDSGGRSLFATHADATAFVEMETDAVLRDIDTPADYESLRRLADT